MVARFLPLFSMGRGVVPKEPGRWLSQALTNQVVRVAD
jgi:hypothetical protein